MNNLKKIMCIGMSALMLLVMTACGGKEQSVTLVNEMDGASYEYQIDAKGDIVHTITQTATVDCSLYTEDQIAMIESSIDEFSTTYSEIDGVTYESGMDGTNLVEKITIDASKPDTLDELSSLGLLPLEGDATFVSLELTVESMKEQGWTEK